MVHIAVRSCVCHSPYLGFSLCPYNTLTEGAKYRSRPSTFLLDPDKMSDASTAFTIDTPLLPTQCSLVELNWAGGTPPYNITVGTFERILANYPSITSTSTTWLANVTAGAALALFGTDADGNLGNSDLFIMGQGTNDSCLQHNKKALGVGAIAGIAAAGAVVCIAALAFLVWICRRGRRGDWNRRERGKSFSRPHCSAPRRTSI